MNDRETFMDKLGRVITMAGTAILMNLLFLICSLPVVTIGQSWCGLLSAIRYNVRGDSWFKGFRFGFKTRFLRGTVVWGIMLGVDIYMLLDLHYAVANAYTVSIVASGVMFALMTMLTAAFLILNVYIPTSIGNWIKNATGMVFKIPLQLLLAAAAMWLPVLLAVFFFDILYYSIMIFVVAYFTLAALGVTMLMKEALMDLLIDARAEGTLLSEEGRYGKDNPQNKA